MSTAIDIKGIDKAELLAGLYNASRQKGMGFLHSRGGRDMTKEQAEEEIKAAQPELYFDYLHGRVMKVQLSGDTLSPWGFDRDNHEGAAAEVVAEIRKKMASNE